MNKKLYRAFFYPVTLLLLFSCCARKEDAAHALVYITHNGSKYHVSDCQYLSSNAIMLPLAEAVERGYESCAYCHPPYLQKDQTLGLEQDSVQSAIVKKQPASHVGTQKMRCDAFIEKGGRCKRMTDDPSGRCWQHK